MDRLVAVLAVAVSFDIYLFDGRYSHATEHLFVSIFHACGF
jgi:hypothetical protein